MRHAYLDRYSRLDSPIHRAPAPVKATLALALLVALVSVPPGAGLFFGSVGVSLALVALLSNVPPRFLLTRLLLFEPVIVGIAALRLLGPDGWASFGAILARSTLCLLTMVLLTSTTPFAEILALLRRLRVPAILVTVLALMYRYLFVLVDEAERMRRARRSRTFDRRRVRAWKLLGDVAGQLFIRSTERAERIYAAMCARGWE